MDSVIRSEIVYDDASEELFHKTSQPSEGIILDRNTELRKNAGAIRDLGSKDEGGSWGRQVASIPFIMYEKALRSGFDLNSKDKVFAGTEMNRFLQTSEGRRCLVQG